MTIHNIEIDKNFMSWLWETDRRTYTLILFGHVELITDELVRKYEESIINAE